MKKNVMRVISLVLVAAVLFAFASCKQEVLIRFVDAQGNDIDINAFANGQSGGVVADEPTAAVETPTEAPTAETPTTPGATEAPTAAPSSDTPTTPTTPGATEAPETPTAAPETPTQAPVSTAPTGVQAIADFYKAAVNRVKNNAEAGYTKKEWQELTAINVLSIANGTILNLAGNYMTKEDEATDQVSDKGSKDSRDRFPAFTLTDYSHIASATCTTLANGNYKIKIVMKDEDTPMSTGSVTGQVTNSVLYWDTNIEPELQKIRAVSDYENIHVIYQHFTIDAEITKDGKFVSLDHTADVDILIGQVTVLVTMKDKSGHLVNYCKYTNFKY